MSYTWNVTGRGFNTDGEPEGAHTLGCKIWSTSDPDKPCDCRPSFEDGVERLVNRFKSYAPRGQGRAS